MAERVLVVDDSPTIRKVVTSILARRGYAYAEAADGDAALAQLQVGEPFDVVLLDFVMPKKNGYQFCRELDELKKSALAAPRFEVPIVLMSAKAEDVRERFLEETGVVDAIGKPFDEEALIAVLENALRGETEVGSDSFEVLEVVEARAPHAEPAPEPAPEHGEPAAAEPAEEEPPAELAEEAPPVAEEEATAQPPAVAERLVLAEQRPPVAEPPVGQGPEDNEEQAEDMTSAFVMPKEFLAFAARASEVEPPRPSAPTLAPPPVATHTEQDLPSALSTLFEGDEVPFSDQASETTQRVDAMTLLAGKLAEELEGAFGKSADELQQELALRLTQRGLRNVFELFQELEPPAPLAGSLSVFSPNSVLQFVVSESSTGVLVFRRDETSIEITLRDGKVDLAHAVGAPLEFRLGRYFVSEGLLSRGELEDFLSNFPPKSGALRRPLGERLLEAGKLTDRSLHEVLTLQSSELVYEVLRWTRGTFEFRASERTRLADRAQLGLHVPTLVLDGLRRLEHWRHIEQNLGSFDDVYAIVPGLAGVEDKRLSDLEQRVLALVDGARSVREVIAVSSRSSFDVCRILSQFVGAGMLVTKEPA